MVFVDAHRYLKVQDEDLAEAFNAKSQSNHGQKGSSHHTFEDDDDDHDNKYSKASFESFQIEPTRFDESSSSMRLSMPQWLQTYWRAVLLTLLALSCFVALILILVFVVADYSAVDMDFDAGDSDLLDTGT